MVPKEGQPTAGLLRRDFIDVWEFERPALQMRLYFVLSADLLITWEQP